MKIKNLSGRRLRMARAWLPYYEKLDRLPQRGVLVFGGGINPGPWMAVAREAGFYVTVYADRAEYR